MTPDDLGAIEALAAAATPGPWRAKDWGPYPKTNIPDWTILGPDHIEPGPPVLMRTFGFHNGPADAAYIAALDPATVQQLIAAARLGAAWREAEEALPEGWTLAQLVRRQTVGRLTPPPERLWKATAQHGPRSDAEPWFSVSGPTPAAALLSLAEALRGRK